jgi:hypothetical protein
MIIKSKIRTFLDEEVKFRLLKHKNRKAFKLNTKNTG